MNIIDRIMNFLFPKYYIEHITYKSGLMSSDLISHFFTYTYPYPVILGQYNRNIGYTKEYIQLPQKYIKKYIYRDNNFFKKTLFIRKDFYDKIKNLKFKFYIDEELSIYYMITYDVKDISKYKMLNSSL